MAGGWSSKVTTDVGQSAGAGSRRTLKDLRFYSRCNEKPWGGKGEG